MTNAEVQAVIDDATTRDIKIDDWDARIFLCAKAELLADPKNERARRVLKRYTALINTGVRAASFDDFSLNGNQPIRTDEEIDEMRSRGCKYL